MKTVENIKEDGVIKEQMIPPNLMHG